MESPKVILITRCSSSVGLELSNLYPSHHQLLLTALPQSIELEEEEKLFVSDPVIHRELDVTSTQSMEKIINNVIEPFSGVHILVNDAGINYRGILEEMHLQDHLKPMSTNFFGAMEFIRLVLPHMRSHKSGHIINVSSVSGMMAMPTMGP